ncbi:MAG: RNA polymerase sigma factor RpoD/SigA [Acholeplasmatales bacterium]|nr:RNA polymerase sigma factor RpoD/SigA [Acholeplasmatales bacterium]
MKELKLLTVEEENELAVKVEEGHMALERLNKKGSNLSSDEINYLNGVCLAGTKARDTLFSANTRLVYHMVKEYEGKGVEKDDLIQAGLMGLLKGCENFKANSGAKFSTYASYWIMDSLGRCVTATGRAIRLPNQVCQSINKYKRTCANLEAENGNTPSVKEIANKMGIKEAEVVRLIELNQKINSLDVTVDSDEETTFGELMADNTSESPLEKAIRKRLGAKLYPALRSVLDDRELYVISQYFGLDDKEGKTYEEIGKDIKLSREGTRQLLNKSLEKLRLSKYSNDLKSLLLCNE